MNIECLQEKFHNAVKHVEKVTGKNLTLPILSSVLLITEEGLLKLRATNLNVGVEVQVPAKIEDGGMVAVNGNVLSTTLSNMKSTKNIQLNLIEGNIQIKSDDSSALVKSLDPEDFPTLPRVEKGVSFTVSLQKFIESLKAVSYAAAFSEIKPEIASVYMYPDNGELYFVATDSFRLAEKKLSVKNLPEFSGVMIPIKNVQDIIKVFGGDKGDVEVTLDENQLGLVCENTYLTSRLVEGIFPDYRQIITQEFTTNITALTSDILQALRMTDIFADKFNQVDVSVKPQEKKVVFSSKNADIGESTTDLSAAVSGEEIMMSINHKYLSDVFQSLVTDSTSFDFVAVNRPIIVRGVGDKTFLYLIMPMNR